MKTIADALQSTVPQITRQSQPKAQSSGLQIQRSRSEGKPKFYGASDVELREPAYKCKHCKDMRFVSDASGKPTRCTRCADLVTESRLNPYERCRIDDIQDRPRNEDPQREALAVRFLCKQMLAEPFGFLSFAGIVGNAKSMALAALVTEFCYAGKQAQYYTAPEICRGPRSLTDFENGDPQALVERLKRLPVLALDEIDKLKWTEYQIETLGEIIDHRHRNADTQVTLFSMNRGPEQWRNAEDAIHIASRLRDGRFNRYWPDEYAGVRPGCAVQDQAGWYIPGLLELAADDIRPRLRRYEA